MCRIFRRYRSIQEFMFVFKFKLIIPEIGGHALTEGSWLSFSPKGFRPFSRSVSEAPTHWSRRIRQCYFSYLERGGLKI